MLRDPLGVVMEWFDLGEARNKLRAFSVIIGGRGIGKTYSAINFLMTEEKPFIYLRNTDVQLKESSTSFGNPFKRWNLDHDRNVVINKEGMHSVIKEGSAQIGYAAALSTFENMRGVDLSDVKYVLFDEFIERRTLSFKQFETFANFYETVNRNRELMGEDPLIVIMLSNAQKLSNPILSGYGFIEIIERMIIKGKREYIGPDCFIALPASPVSEAKRNTANYRLTRGTLFEQEAIGNTFAYDSFRGIGKRPLKEYSPLVAIDNIFIYKHKSTGKYYACRSESNTVKCFESKDEKSLFMRYYGILLRDADIRGVLEYSDFTIKSELSDILK